MIKHLRVRSRNKSRAILSTIPTKYTAIFRLGSFTPTSKITSNRCLIEINSAEACGISNDKKLMKTRFTRGKISTAKWAPLAANIKLSAPYIVKHVNSSGGKGIYYCENIEELEKLKVQLTNHNRYIVEEYKTYSKEYRLHVTREGCFYASRKMLKSEATVRWHRHHMNSVWIKESNPSFDKPLSWDKIVANCVAAMKSIGADLCAVDVKVQKNNVDDPKFIILETNTAPALGEEGIEKYTLQLTKMLQ